MELIAQNSNAASSHFLQHVDSAFLTNMPA